MLQAGAKAGPNLFGKSPLAGLADDLMFWGARTRPAITPGLPLNFTQTPSAQKLLKVINASGRPNAPHASTQRRALRSFLSNVQQPGPSEFGKKLVFNKHLKDTPALKKMLEAQNLM